MTTPRTDFPTNRSMRGIVVIAASAGGIPALGHILAPLPASFPLPILIGQHLSPTYPSRLAAVLGWHTRLHVKWAEDGEYPTGGTVYVTPPNRHLAIAPTRRLTLSEIGGARYRPMVNLLFESAATMFGSAAIGIVLSGMMDDGARGLLAITARGGITMAQSELTCEFFEMPAAAIDFGQAELIASPQKIAEYLLLLGDGLETPSRDAA